MKNLYAVLEGCSVPRFVLFFKSYSALLHSVGSANKTYCDNDKFPLFVFRPLHSLHTRPICSHSLHKPKYGSPIFGKQHVASQYTTSRNDPLHYKTRDNIPYVSSDFRRKEIQRRNFHLRNHNLLMPLSNIDITTVLLCMHKRHKHLETMFALL